MDKFGQWLSVGDKVTDGKRNGTVTKVDQVEGWVCVDYGSGHHEWNTKFATGPWAKLGEQEAKEIIAAQKEAFDTALKSVIDNAEQTMEEVDAIIEKYNSYPEFKIGDIVVCIQRAGIRDIVIEIGVPYTIRDIENHTVFLEGYPGHGFSCRRFQLYAKVLETMGDW